MNNETINGRTIATEDEIVKYGLTDKDLHTFYYGTSNARTVESFIYNRLRAKAIDEVARDMVRDGEWTNVKQARDYLYNEVSDEERMNLKNAKTKELLSSVETSYRARREQVVPQDAFFNSVQQNKTRELSATSPTATTTKGYVYIVQNTSDLRYKDILKIGATKNPNNRLDRTWNIFDEYKMVWAIPSNNYLQDEKRIHRLLKQQGVNNPAGEWFELSVEDAKEFINTHITEGTV